jgi:phosphoglycerate dehydrogenase-like enzyme
VSRRLVIDLAATHAAWRITAPSVAAIRAALPGDWDVVEVRAPAVSAGDGGGAGPEAIAAATGAEVYLGFGVPPGVVEAGQGTLRWMHSGTAGVGSGLAALRGTDVLLTNSAGVHAEPMADWVIAAIGYFARGLDRAVAAQALGRWTKQEFEALTLPVREFRDLRIGILGLGGIGTAVARRALALGMAVAGVRRRPERGGGTGEGGRELRWVGALDELSRLAAESDCLVIAAPHTGATAGAVSRRVLECLPRHAVVVNVSRGSLLDEAALLDLIDQGRLGGAALDVFSVEPLPPEHPFWGHPRILVSPHVSAVTSRFWERETALIVDNIKRYLAGAPLTNVVDLEAGY